jgi:prophage tail gpP-like protein
MTKGKGEWRALKDNTAAVSARLRSADFNLDRGNLSAVKARFRFWRDLRHVTWKMNRVMIVDVSRDGFLGDFFTVLD